MYIIHEQKQKSYFWLTAIYLFSSLILLLLAISPPGLGLPPLPWITRIILGIVFLVDILIFRSFYELKFKITSEGLEFGYGLFKTKIAKNDIKSIIIDTSKGNFFGYGVRFNKRRIMGYIARTGKGLMIETDRNKKFFVTMSDPEQALQIIKQSNYVSR